MLFHTLYAPNSGVYVEQLSCVLRGKLDIPAFEESWQQAVDRHSALRTAFAWERLDEPLQIVGRRVRLPIELLDWRGLDQSERKKKLEEMVEAERARGFELSKAPLMRLTLIRLAADVHQFLWTYHHLLLDGWSLPTLLGEVFASYDALSRGMRPRLAQPRPYGDYIAWLSQQDRREAERFWRESLKGLSLPTPIPVGESEWSRAQETRRYGRQEIKLSQTTSAALEDFARRRRLTLNTIFQGSWALLLSRYSGLDDVVFGATVSGRPPELPGVASMIGLFINTLPVRVRVEGGRTLPEWLQEIQDHQAEARQYEYSSLVEIQGWSETPRSQQLFESILVFENYPIGEAIKTRQAEIEVTDLRVFEQTNYPLTVAAAPGQEIKLLAGYDGNRFDDATVTRLLDHWMLLLEQMAANPLAKLADYRLLTEAERERLVVDLNQTATARRQGVCAHQLFEEQVAKTPNAIAVIAAGETLTYLELNRQANQLARHLRGIGVSPEDRVGICLERGSEMLVCILAVLKAGAAYVPIDPRYPEERLAFMLHDGQVSALITRSDLAADLYRKAARVVRLDSNREEISRLSDENPVFEIDAEQLAYAIYTSGSTGHPRGVMVSHEALVNFTLAMVDAIELAPGDRFLQFASFSFDASVVQIFPTLVSGAALVLHTAPGELSNMDLLRLCETNEVTILDLPAAFWRQWVDEMVARRALLKRPLRVFMTGGESLSAEKLKALLGLVERPAKFISSYGPTEATVAATIYQNTEGLDAGVEARKLPIGKLLPNTQIYLLDKDLHPTPIGAPGELHIGGIGLARGYLNQPHLTAEKFIPNPFSKVPGARLYRTGDQARFLADGNIEFLGRIDHQVKIRGFRIELQEIEETLVNHHEVEQAVVVARGDGAGDKRLVAYVVPRQETALEPGRLRAHLRERLPEYMIPSLFVSLDQLPLTPNGKIDRKALPDPEPVIREYTPPRNATEADLASIWSAVLRADKIGVYDNFFDMGGYSLLAIQVISRARESFGVDLPVRRLFDNPTIAEMALAIEDARMTADEIAETDLIEALEEISDEQFGLLLDEIKS